MKVIYFLRRNMHVEIPNLWFEKIHPEHCMYKCTFRSARKNEIVVILTFYELAKTIYILSLHDPGLTIISEQVKAIFTTFTL